ncbi:MAG: type II toxin-antitoxin system PemK/MazF family toxin [Myxococcota bacterium]
MWWAELAEPHGSEPGLRRPVLVVQGDPFNRSKIATIVCGVLTSRMKWADAPGNVALAPRDTGLPKHFVANVSQLATLDRTVLTQRSGKIGKAKFALILAGIDIVLGR